MSGLGVRWSGQAPWDEVYFFEGTSREGAGLWLRYTLTAGPDPRAAVWAAWRPAPSPDRPPSPPIVGYRELPLPPEHDPVDALRLSPTDWLTVHAAHGDAGPLRWALRLHGSGGWRANLVPPIIGRLGRTYRAVIPDATAEGELRIGDQAQSIRLSGVLGHLWGRRSRVTHWGWAHSARWDAAPGTVLEVLVARLAWRNTSRRPVGALVLHHQGKTLRLADLPSLLRSRVDLHPRGFTLVATRRATTVRARFDLPPGERCVLARYDSPHGDIAHCLNAPGARLRVRVSHLGRRTLALATDRAVGEVAGPAIPGAGPVLGRHTDAAKQDP